MFILGGRFSLWSALFSCSSLIAVTLAVNIFALEEGMPHFLPGITLEL